MFNPWVISMMTLIYLRTGKGSQNYVLSPGPHIIGRSCLKC